MVSKDIQFEFHSYTLIYRNTISSVFFFPHISLYNAFQAMRHIRFSGWPYSILLHKLFIIICLLQKQFKHPKQCTQGFACISTTKQPHLTVYYNFQIDFMHGEHVVTSFFFVFFSLSVNYFHSFLNIIFFMNQLHKYVIVLKSFCNLR